MLVAGWQFGLRGTDAPSSENEVALEKAVEGSGSGDGICCEVDIISDICKTQIYPVYREYYGKPYFC